MLKNAPLLNIINENQLEEDTSVIMYQIKNYDTKTFFINWTRSTNLKERLKLHKKRDLKEWLADGQNVKMFTIQ